MQKLSLFKKLCRPHFKKLSVINNFIKSFIKSKHPLC